MSAFGASIGRGCWFPKDFHKVYPMLNILLIGSSGIGKSTSLGMGLELLNGLPFDARPQVIKGKATKEKIHEDLMVEPHAVLVASELANMFSKERYMEGMIPYVTQLLDYEPTCEIRTKGGKIQIINNPAVTIVGGSTVQWLQDELPDSAGAGGFLARFFIVKEDHKFQRVADPETQLTPTQWESLQLQRARAYDNFFQLTQMHRGKVGYRDYAAKDIYDLWYNTQMPETGHLAPFSARAGEFVTRLAMILALSSGTDRVRDIDLQSAISLYNYSAKKLQEVVVPFSADGKLLAECLKCIGTQPISEADLKHAMRNQTIGTKVDQLVTSLIQSRDIVRLPDGRLRRGSR